MVQLTPLYELSRQIKTAEEKIEVLRQDPNVTYEEIAEIEALLLQHKVEYAMRIDGLR